MLFVRLKMALTEQQKVQALYKLIGDRGLYVNTNFDVFTTKPEEVPLGVGYNVPLISPGSRAYASPLLFATLTSLLNHGTMLITGAPGIGKTTGAEFAGHFFTGTPLDDILAAEIQGHPQQTEEKMVARYELSKLIGGQGEEVIPRKFLECPVKLVDEVTRLPPDAVSIIMGLVDRGKAVYGNQLLTAKPGPLFATANYSDEGTFQLTPPFLDRFDVAVMVTSPQPWDLARIRARGDEKLNGGLDELLKVPTELALDFGKIRKEINALTESTKYDIPITSTFADFVYGSLRFSEAASTNLARSTKGNTWQVNQDNAAVGHFTDSPFTYTLNELSVRTARAMMRYAKAFAWLNGKDKVEPEDLKTVLPYLLWHKLQPTQKALNEDPRYANDRIALVEGLITKIENDYNELTGNEDVFKTYAIAFDVARKGLVRGKEVGEDGVRNVVKNAIARLGSVDKSWVIPLGAHLASEFNMRSQEGEYKLGSSINTKK